MTSHVAFGLGLVNFEKMCEGAAVPVPVALLIFLKSNLHVRVNLVKIIHSAVGLPLRCTYFIFTAFLFT